MDEEEIKSFLERTDDLGARLTGEDKETFTWVVYGYNQCAKLLKEMEQKVEEQQKDYLEALKVKHERAYEIEKLKKQLYELGGVDEFNKHLLTQQDEFIKYLEEEEKKCYESIGIQQSMYAYKMFVEVLQKYKEIIGDINDKK